MGRCSIIAAFLAAHRVLAHPQCYVNEKNTDFDEVLTFCPEDQFALQGACCTDAEEAAVQARVEAAGTLTDDCADLYKQVQCGQCHSYSGHLFALLGDELGVADGLMLTSEFCEEFINTCDGQIPFPTYDDGESYCEKHTGAIDWAYPYVEDEVFEPGLTKLFPDLDNASDFPDKTIGMHQSPDGSMYWLMGQRGEIKSVDADDLGSISTVVDISGGEFYEEYEEGLMDFAFGPLFSEPDYPSYFYVSYTAQVEEGEVGHDRLSKFEYFPGDPNATRASEEILIDAEAGFNDIHSGGFCGFKPSDYGNTAASSHDLYWSTGDGGPQGDDYNHSQDTTNFLGSIIRISVPSDGMGYAIPDGNLGSAPDVLPEICASGFRNPWRCGFDRDTDELYCGDVGNTYIEEIDLIECGNNYGWSRFEGSLCFRDNEERDGPCADADRSGFTFPMFEYCHNDYVTLGTAEDDFADGITGGTNICGDHLFFGNAVIGGYVYRGSLFEDLLSGAYIFGDIENKGVYFIKKDGNDWTVGSIVSDQSVQIVSFAEDVDGELMLITQDGNIYRMSCGDLCPTPTCLDQEDVVPTVESLGCFVDDADDRALGIMAETCGDGEKEMSPEICAKYCLTTEGTAYAGVQYYNECFCGTSSSNFDRHGSSEGCNLACTANPDEFCGGLNAIEVYEIVGFTIPTPAPTTTAAITAEPSTPEPSTPAPVTTDFATLAPVTSSTDLDLLYSGCFADSEDGRVFDGDVLTRDDMTKEICAEFCEGSTFFGLQYSTECWCGDVSTQNSGFWAGYREYGEGVCDMPCGGNEDEMCGGNYANSAWVNLSNF